MNFRKQPSNLRGIVLAMLLLVLLQNVISTGWLTTKPSGELQASKTFLTYPCPPHCRRISHSCPSTNDLEVGLTALTRNFSKQLVYVYTVTGGRVIGEGGNVTWDLNECGPGLYTATVEVQDNRKHRALSSVNVALPEL